MNCIEEYLNLTISYKDYYIMNNDSIKEEDVSTTVLFDLINSDVDIVLNSLNIKPSANGYNYWKDAIFIFIFSGENKISICKQIYPLIGKKYGKSAISIERAMRVCFENALYENAKKNNTYIFRFMKNYLLFPHNSELLVKITELVVSRTFQVNKSNMI